MSPTVPMSLFVGPEDSESFPAEESPAEFDEGPPESGAPSRSDITEQLNAQAEWAESIAPSDLINLEGVSQHAGAASETSTKPRGGRPKTRASGRLNAKQTAFIDEYMKDRNATQAYIRAGYSKNGAQQSSSRLLLNAVVSAEIQRRTRECSRVADVGVVDILKGLNAIALANIKDFFDESGNLLPVHKLPAATLASLATLRIRQVPGKQNGAPPTRIIEIRLQDKVKALFALLDYARGLPKKAPR